MTDVASDQTITRRFVPHPDDERFDRIEVTSTERWKESELSGDEWRFSFVADCWSHGVLMAQVHGRSIEDVTRRVAGTWSSIPWVGVGKDTPPAEAGEIYKALRAEVEDRCSQPGCSDQWVVLLHPVKAYTAAGEELARPYHDDRASESSVRWLDVRGFCDRHRHRGDCGLDDSDANYELVEERFPPDWASAGGEGPSDA